MREIPRLKTKSDRQNLSIAVDRDVEKIYRLGKANGHNTTELVRQAISQVLRENAPELMERTKSTG